jgi:hypothetical protein
VCGPAFGGDEGTLVPLLDVRALVVTPIPAAELVS